MRLRALVVVLLTACPAGASAQPVVAGTWQVTYTPMNYAGDTTTERWRMRSCSPDQSCAFVGTGGQGRHTFRSVWPQSYVWTLRPGASPSGDCVNADGSVAASDAWFSTYRMRLKATSIRDGKVRVLRGTWRENFKPSGTAAAAGCEAGAFEDRVFARRL